MTRTSKGGKLRLDFEDQIDRVKTEVGYASRSDKVFQLLLEFWCRAFVGCAERLANFGFILERFKHFSSPCLRG